MKTNKKRMSRKRATTNPLVAGRNVVNRNVTRGSKKSTVKIENIMDVENKENFARNFSKENEVPTKVGFLEGLLSVFKGEKQINRLIKSLIYVLVFLLPFFFLPITTSPWGLNKLLMMILVTGVAGIIWLGKLATSENPYLKKTFLYLPLIFLVFIWSLSSAFGIYKENSFWGYTGGEEFSLVALIFFGFLFVIILNNFYKEKNARTLTKIILSLGVVLLFTGILGLFNVNVWFFLKVKGQDFNPIGDLLALIIFAGGMLVYSLFLMKGETNRGLIKFLSFSNIFLALFILLSLKFKLVWIILTIFSSFLVMLVIAQKEKRGKALFFFALFAFALSLINLFSNKPLLPIIQNFNQEVNPILPSFKLTMKVFWKGLKEETLLGVGPSNFNYLFTKYKGNLGEISGVNFNQGRNFFLTLLSTGGLLGIFASLLFFISIAYQIITKLILAILSNNKNSYYLEKETDIIIPTGFFLIFLSLTFFFGASSFTLVFFWWVLLGIFSGLTIKESFSSIFSSSRMNLVVTFVLMLAITGISFAFYKTAYHYLASYYYSKAISESKRQDSNWERVGYYLQKSITLKPNKEEYLLGVADFHLSLINKRIGEKKIEELNEDDRKYNGEQLSSAIQATNMGIVANPNNFNSYLKLASLYQLASGSEESGERLIEEIFLSLNKSQKLNPFDPYVYNQIAKTHLLVYDKKIKTEMEKNKAQSLKEIPEIAKEEIKKAEDSLNRAIEINPRDLTACITLVSVKELQGDMESAILMAKKNVSLFPDYREKLILDLMLLNYKNKNFDETIKIGEDLIKALPDYADAHYILGLAYAQKQELKKSIEHFEIIKEKNSENKDLDKIITELKSGKTSFLNNPNGQEQVQEIKGGLRDEAEERVINQNNTTFDSENKEDEE